MPRAYGGKSQLSKALPSESYTISNVSVPNSTPKPLKGSEVRCSCRSAESVRIEAGKVLLQGTA